MAVSAQRRPETDGSALTAYEELAEVYDLFTADYAHEPWLDALEGLGIEHGLEGRRLLDVACGTGKSFLPMLARGYEVTGCDLSPAMLAQARLKVGAGTCRLLVADMRDLPPLGPFDLVTCLDDAVNYLLNDCELFAALGGIARALRPGGLALFDANTRRTYRKTFASDFVVDHGGTVFCWRGEGRADLGPAEISSALIEILTAPGRDGRRRRTSRHVQRHHPRALVEAACRAAGLDCCAVRGQLPGGRLAPEADEEEHSKFVYVARKLGHRDLPIERRCVADDLRDRLAVMSRSGAGGGFTPRRRSEQVA